jgi:hypothetical protein
VNRNEMVPPPRQQVFEFARTDVWSQLSAAAQEGCLQLIVQQLKQVLEFEQKEAEDE